MIWNKLVLDSSSYSVKMEVSYDILKAKEDNFDQILTANEKYMISFQSIKIFLFYFNQFESSQEKRIILEKLDLYFTRLEEGGFSFHVTERKSILKYYINPIAFYYKLRFNFQFYIPLRVIIFIGIHLDLIMLIFGILKKVYFIPVCSIVLILYWVYLKTFFVSKRKYY